MHTRAALLATVVGLVSTSAGAGAQANALPNGQYLLTMKLSGPLPAGARSQSVTDTVSVFRTGNTVLIAEPGRPSFSGTVANGHLAATSTGHGTAQLAGTVSGPPAAAQGQVTVSGGSGGVGVSRGTFTLAVIPPHAVAHMGMEHCSPSQKRAGWSTGPSGMCEPGQLGSGGGSGADGGSGGGSAGGGGNDSSVWCDWFGWFCSSSRSGGRDGGSGRHP